MENNIVPPNSKRVIVLTYESDENSNLDIDVASLGFDGEEELVPLYIANTLKVLLGD